MPSPFRQSIRTAIVAVAVSCLPAAAEAQAWVLAAGPSVPQGPMSERRTVGGQVAIGFGSEHHRRGFQYRVEIAYGRFPVAPAYSERSPDGSEGMLALGSGLVYLLYSGAPGPVSLHAGIGAGAHDMNIPGHSNPYGYVPGVGVLFGARIGTGRVRGLIELQQQAILSDYGNAELQASTFVPLRFGVVVQ